MPLIRLLTLTAALLASPPTDAGHARLAAMVGTWDVELTLWLRPGGAPVSAKGRSVIRPLFDGLFIEETIDATMNGSAVQTRAWTGYNPENRQYEATRISSTNASRVVESGAYDEQAKRFALNAEYPLAGETWHQRTEIEMPSPDTMTAVSYLRFGAVPEWKATEIKYGRRRD
ncbi:MAG TPA: DUF1579 family protein [Vicinamibacterales bacterium]|nr:DUF1579 family protein [Vicinamibacterales bacterium]